MGNESSRHKGCDSRAGADYLDCLAANSPDKKYDKELILARMNQTPSNLLRQSSDVTGIPVDKSKPSFIRALTYDEYEEPETMTGGRPIDLDDNNEGEGEGDDSLVDIDQRRELAELGSSPTGETTENTEYTGETTGEMRSTRMTDEGRRRVRFNSRPEIMNMNNTADEIARTHDTPQLSQQNQVKICPSTMILIAIAIVSIILLVTVYMFTSFGRDLDLLITVLAACLLGIVAFELVTRRH